MAFPPSKAKGNAPVPQNSVPSPTSTGGGGIPKSLKVKAAGTKDAPGFDKNVNNF